jgi:hypothetical protein
VEIKLKWIPQKQMTHENTYRDDIGFGAKMVSFYYYHLDLKENVMVLTSLRENLNDSK